MANRALFVVLLVLMPQFAVVTGLTNREFYELVKPFATDVEDGDFRDLKSDDVDDDVIDLPGGPDDDLDMENLLKQLIPDLEDERDSSLPNWPWHHHHHHHHHHHCHPDTGCHCHKYGCKCCLAHTFRCWCKKFTLKACAEVDILPHEYGVEMTISLNGHRLFHHKISLLHPPALCFGVPGLTTFARVCLEIYDVDLKCKHVCLRLTGVLDLKITKFKVHLKLGCFRVPILDNAAMLKLLKVGDVIEIEEVSGKDTDIKPVSLADILPIFLEQKEQESDKLTFTEV